jgi:hypothetical protein
MWKMTISVFVFVQVMGVVVITIVLIDNDPDVPKLRVLIAYGAFLALSGCLSFAGFAVKRMVDRIYHC